MLDLARILSKSKPGYDDDLKILRNWAEYSDDRANMNYLMYELEMEDASGKVTHFYKAIKLLRIIRLPKSAKQSKSFMDMHAQVLAAIWERNIKFITVIANMLNPVPLGLMYLYGVQGVAETEEQAKFIADNDYIALTAVLQGTYRVLEYKVISYQELEWLREKMFSMRNMTVVRGIPKAKAGGVDGGDKGMGAANVNPESQDTTEEFIAGMSDKEYVVQILSTPVKAEHLERWLAQTAQEMTRWNKQLQGTTSFNAGISLPMMYMANLGASEGWSHSYTESESLSTSATDSVSTSFSTSVGESISQSFGESVGHSFGESFSESTGESYNTSIGTSEGTSWGESIGTSQGTSQNFSENASFGNSYTESTNESTSHTDSTNSSLSEGTSTNTSTSHSESTSVSDGTGTSQSTSNTTTNSSSQGWSSTTGGSTSQSHSTTETDTTGTNSSTSHGTSDTRGTTHTTSSSSTVTDTTGGSSSTSETDGWSRTRGSSSNEGVSIIYSNSGGSNSGSTESGSTTTTEGTSWSTSNASTRGTSDATSNSHTTSNTTTTGTSQSHSTGVSNGTTNTQSWSNGTSGSTSVSHSTGTTVGTSTNHTETRGYSDTVSQGYGTSTTVSNGVGASDSTSQGSGESWGQTSSYSQGTSVGMNQNASHSANVGGNSGVSTSDSWGLSSSRSYGQTSTDSYTQSATSSAGRNYSESNGVGQSQSWGTSNGQSIGQSLGTTGAISSGTSSSMGLGPSISYGKSYQWLDQEVKNILTLLEFQNLRLMKALMGNGAFFTDVYIATPNKETQAAASILAKSAWQNEEAMICPLQVLDLKKEEQEHLLYHFSAFSADNTKEGIPGRMESYRYSTILLPGEFTAFTHMPRISEGGVFADVNDMPKFAVPSMKKGDIYMGKILSGERWTPNDGYETKFDYRLDEGELMHGIFTGESRSGKTVAATRFVAELTKVRRKKTGKRLRIVALDPKQDWRILGKFVEPERFHFYSLGNPEFLPINLNICKVPHNVNPQTWVDGIIEIYCRSYGLLERGKAILAETFYSLYSEAGVFEDSPNWRDFVPERSSKVTMCKIYERMMKIKVDLEDPTVSGKGRMGNEARDAYTRVLDRMQVFGRKFSIESRLFGQEDGIAVDELIGGDDIIVLESYGLETTFKNFIFGCVTSGFFKYAQGHEGGFLAADQYETVLIIEEANEVLTGSDTAGSGGGNMPSLGGQSEFEKILDQSAGLGLFIIAITQKIADMPSSCVANSGLIFAGKISRADDVTLVIRKIGREERYDDRDILKWFPRSPIGWFVCRSSRNFDFKDTEPVLVHIDPLGVNPPSNKELETIIAERKAMELLYT